MNSTFIQFFYKNIKYPDNRLDFRLVIFYNRHCGGYQMIYGIRYAYFDLDGTLVPSSGKITNRTALAISYLKSKGIKIGIATGRNKFFTKPFADVITPDLPYVCINGAVILDTNFGILKEELFPRSAYDIFDIFVEKNIPFLIYTRTGVFFNSIEHPFYKKLADMKVLLHMKETFDFKCVTNIEFYKNIDFYKILVYYESQLQKKELENILDQFKDISYASSQVNVLDIFSAKADKSYGIKYVLDRLNKKTDSLIVFGDNENDIKMFKSTFNSVCLDDAKDEVKAYATMWTDLSCDNEGVADFIFKNF